LPFKSPIQGDIQNPFTCWLGALMSLSQYLAVNDPPQTILGPYYSAHPNIDPNDPTSLQTKKQKPLVIIRALFH